MKRKPYNPMKRWANERRALLSLHSIAVVNIDPEGRQGLINWKSCKNVPTGRDVAEAVCEIAHRWVVYLGAFCIDQRGERYIKASEIAPDGIYKSDHLADVLEHCYRELLDGCNPKHLIGSGWIAIPVSKGQSLDEVQAAKVFEACGAWSQARAAA